MSGVSLLYMNETDNNILFFISLTLTKVRVEQGPENEMWNTYLDLVKDDDKRISDAWKDDSTGILLFVSPNLLTLFVLLISFKTGLFSASLSAFIIDVYKNLAPGSGH